MTESQGCPFTYIFPAPGRAWLPGYEAGLSDLPADILFQHDFHILGCFLFFFSLLLLLLLIKKGWAEASQTGTIFELLLVQLFNRVGLFGTI